MKRAATFALVTTFALVASAQPSSKASLVHPAAPKVPTNVRSHVGTEHATRLVRSADPEERIRGIQRAASIGTPEALSLLLDSLEQNPQIKADTRALVAMARGLSRFADQDRARAGLLAIVGSGGPGLGGRAVTTRATSADALDEGDPVSRAELARQVAAMALAKFGGDRALESLYGVARAGGSGQYAALAALTTFPPRDAGFFGTNGASIPVPVVTWLGRLGDLRALDVLHQAARAHGIEGRCAALVALAELGDERAKGLAGTAIADNDVRLREAAGEAFILLGASERFKATVALLSEEATAWIGVRMAERVYSPEITKLVAARAFVHPDRELRVAAVRALGRSPDPEAAKALIGRALLDDRELGYNALEALARSPAPNAGALLASLFSTPHASLAARAYVVRALVRGERNRSSDDAIAKFASARTSTERALGVQALVALGDADATSFLDDRDPRVRRAAVMGTLARRAARPSIDRSLLTRLTKETDPTTRQLLAVGLLGGDPDGTIKTSTLIDRAGSGAGDAAVATYALARRSDEEMHLEVHKLLTSTDPVLRAHAARGLAMSSLPDASGRLANAYAYETNVGVRRAIMAALAERTADTTAPARQETLAIAADLDPDGPVRQIARRALTGVSTLIAPSSTEEIAWLRLTLAAGSPPGDVYTGSVVRPDQLAVPIAFDEEGFALVAGLPPGESRLVLAPRMPSEKETRIP